MNCLIGNYKSCIISTLWMVPLFLFFFFFSISFACLINYLAACRTAYFDLWTLFEPMNGACMMMHGQCNSICSNRFIDSILIGLCNLSAFDVIECQQHRSMRWCIPLCHMAHYFNRKKIYHTIPYHTITLSTFIQFAYSWIDSCVHIHFVFNQLNDYSLITLASSSLSSYIIYMYAVRLQTRVHKILYVGRSIIRSMMMMMILPFFFLTTNVSCHYACDLFWIVLHANQRANIISHI